MLKRARRCISDGQAPSHNALSSRGCPNPDNATVYTRSRSSSSKSRSKSAPVVTVDYAEQVTIALAAMLTAQAQVKLAKGEGRPTAELAAKARACRSAYLALTGGIESRMIDVDQGSNVNPLIAV